MRVQGALLAVMLVMLCGCAPIRLAAYVKPSLRFDQPHNAPLPTSDHPAVQEALAQWNSLRTEERPKWPTPLHVYVDTPAAGRFEGDHAIGLAFSGGGTRGTVYGAACVAALAELGPIIVSTVNGEVEINLLQEVDYVSGISTGSIPAAAFALNFGASCPEPLRFANWPDCFNLNSSGFILNSMWLRPDWLMKGFVTGMHNRALTSAGVAGLYFEGNRYAPASGLTFGDLPTTPVLLLGATVINDPGAPFIQTRLPYRFALDEAPAAPWAVGVQSFESFGTDPMTYPLGEACFNSFSFPGRNTSGLMKVHDDPPWLTANLPTNLEARMRRARHQAGYRGTYDLKDGGLTDNRGTYVIARLFDSVDEFSAPPRKPLLIGLDASVLRFRQPKAGGGILRKGWLGELGASSLTSWQTGQHAFHDLVKTTAQFGAYEYVEIRYDAWVHLLSTAEPRDHVEERMGYLRKLCRAAPEIQTVERLVTICQELRTSFGRLTPEQLAAVRINARYAVWTAKAHLLTWASRQHNGAPAHFAER